MPSPFRCGPLVLVSCAVAAAWGCSSPSATPQACQTSAQCSATARCLSSTCVANSPPVAHVSLPAGALEANLLLVFDGSGSADPDAAAGDAIATYAWAFRAVDASCAPPVVSGAGPAASVRFACAGTYAVDLTVTDALAAAGFATRELVVGAYSGPQRLVVGADVVLDHACTTSPTRCAPVGAVSLSAAPTADAPPYVSVAWTVEPPPDRPLDTYRRVLFEPSPAVPSPTVVIETDGQAISGDWIFRVEARDEAGVVASGVTRVSVGNRPPTLTRTLFVVNHAFDGALFTASGEIPFTVADPDGDALAGPSVEWRHTGDGPGGLFFGTVATAPDRVTFSIGVPYTAPGDALHLIGGEGLERSIRFSMADVNGAEVAEVWPIPVANRAPLLWSAPAGVTVPHSYDAEAQAYRATASLSTWWDPDGDPLLPVSGATTGDPACTHLDVVGAVSRVSCSLAFTGVPAVASFAGTHVVTQHVQDPWEAAPAPSTVAFTIANGSPTIDAAAVDLGVSCSLGDCCSIVPDPETGQPVCVARSKQWGPGTESVSGRWHDPDGDPLLVTVSDATPLVCTPDTCSMPFGFAGATLCGSAAPALPRYTTAGDGAETASATIDIDLTCL